MPLKVRSIGVPKHKSKEFILTIIYIAGIDKKSCEIYTSINYELHLINGLRTNMLVDNNVLYTTSFAINFSISSTLIYSYGIRIDIKVRQYSEFLKQKFLASGSILVLP